MSHPAISKSWTPNRSLTPAGRMIWLCMLGGSCLLVAVAFALLGAWLILPFAGLEVALLVWAFRQVSNGDNDFEAISASGGLWRLDIRRGTEVQSAEGALAWLGVGQTRRAGNVELRLRYAGRRYPVGTYLCQSQRLALGQELRKLVESAR